MTPLSPQKQKIFDLYSGKGWVCSTAIHFIRDYRKRISEMIREGYSFRSVRCDGRCGTKHGSNIHMYLLEAPQTPVIADLSPVSEELVIEGLWSEKDPWTGMCTGITHDIYA
jgi:hypothetical protein